MNVANYAALAAAEPCGPAQSSVWVHEWSAATTERTLILDVSQEGTVAALPLEIVRHGPFALARFMGGRHANGNFVPARGSGQISAATIAEAARRSGETIDLIHLERMSETIGDRRNPFADLPRTVSPNIALAVDLDGGFEALLGRASGKRKRKKHRSQTRKFEAVGRFQRVQARTEDEVDRLLSAFFAMKAERFAKMGIADVFAEPSVRRFFGGLFKTALDETPPAFVLHGLEVAGQLRAVTGSSRCGDRFICEFGAIRDDDLAHSSPGDFLFFENIQEACEAGYRTYDFSVGDEPYKRLWCNLEIQQFDVTLPVTAKGRALAAVLAARSRLTRIVKTNPTLWRLTKRLRRQVAAQAAPDDAD